MKTQSDIMNSELGREDISDYNGAVIRAENLSKVYKLYDRSVDRLKESLHPLRRIYHHDFFALKDVSFEIKKGETLGIIGKNGSGKSTLLKIIAGVLTPSGGNLEVRGKVSALLELGIGFNPEMTGRENIYFSGTIMGYSRAEMDAKVDDILTFADIGDFINQPVKTYSSGMFVRLAFAMATNIDPDILIIDEALSVGDIFFQTKCYKKFEQFQQMGKTILFVTHSLENVIRYCHRGIVLDSGVKLIDSDAKSAVDVYKKLMVNCYGNKDENEKKGDSNVRERPKTALVSNECLVNPEATIYGNGRVEVLDYGVFDVNKIPVRVLFNDEQFSVWMKVLFKEDVENPIFAFTIKDLKGMEITGTNSLYEDAASIRYLKGETVVIEFTQRLNMASGQYLLSLGCTGFQGDQFVVYQRLYDILCFEVISYKKFVGFYDMKSDIRIEKYRG
ncbi:MAG: ABC transporter ATP-binding protein [Desulfobacterales bacterium]|nr:ABC transporter ATP-binding protein [Desulfobacterales bacterium]